MVSILEIDVLTLFNQWEERVAFNEGYRKQKIVEAGQAGRDAFHVGIDRAQGQQNYFEAKDQRFSEAQEFLSSDASAIESDAVEIETIEEITDGEETLGMESVVANETEDSGSWYAEALIDHAEAVEAEYNSVSAYDWANAHRMNNELA